MKLRTVIYELPCTDYVARPESLLELDVAVAPSASDIVGTERVLRLCSEQEFEDWRSGAAAGAGDAGDRRAGEPRGEADGARAQRGPSEGAADGAGDDPAAAPALAAASGAGDITVVWCRHEIPERMRSCGPDVVVVASDTDYARFRQLFSAIPGKYLHMSVQRERLFEAFMGSYDVQQFVDKAQKIIENPIIVTNSDRKLLASAGDFPKDRPDVLDEINKGYISEKVNSEMEADGIIEGVRHAHHSVLSDNAKYGQRWVTSIIRFHHLELGRFDVLESGRTITGADLELIDFAGELVGILLDRLGMAGEKAGSGSSVLLDLLTKNFPNEKTMKSQLALTGMPLEGSYVLMSVVGEGMGSDYLIRIGRALQEHVGKSLWCILDGKIVMLIPIGESDEVAYDDYDRAMRVVRSSRGLVGYLKNNVLAAYVCEPFDRLGLAAGRLEQCRALEDANPETKGPVWYFWQWRFEAIAASATTFAQMDMMVDKRVLTMARYDDEHGTAYLETSVMSVRYPGSPADAARELQVHRNTYFYRMNKVRELFLLDLKDGEDRLAVAFTTRVMAYLRNNQYFGQNSQE